jgi:hypothetical protein
MNFARYPGIEVAAGARRGNAFRMRSKSTNSPLTSSGKSNSLWYNAINDALPEGFYISGDQLIGPVGSTVDPDALDVVNHHDVYEIAERVLAGEIG